MQDIVYQIRPKTSHIWQDTIPNEYEKVISMQDWEGRILMETKLRPFDDWWSTLSDECKVKFNKSDCMIIYYAGVNS